MNNFAIITDTSSDLKKAVRERFGIDDYGCGYIHCADGSSIKANLDWSNEECIAFFDEISRKTGTYKSAAPSIGEISLVIEKYLKDGRDVLTVNLSSALSGIYNVFRNAAKDLQEKYPDRKIICVDSLRYSAAEGLLAVLAAKYREQGKTIEETAELIHKDKFKLHQIGWMDDLFYCKKVGRVSNTAAIMGTLVGIKAMADFNDKGMSHVVGKVRGYKKAYRMIIEYMKNTADNLEDQIVFISHSIREEHAQAVKSLIEKELNPKEVILIAVGQGSAPNIGPGLVAAFYLGKEISKDLKDEIQLFHSLAAKL